MNKNIGLLETYVWIVFTFFLTILFAYYGISLRNVYTLLYSALFVMTLSISITMITSYDTICGKSDSNLAFNSIIFPFSFVFMVGVSLIELFPGWTRGFSNTIGSWVINLGDFKNFTYDLLKKDRQNSNVSSTIINKIYEDHTILFNELTTDTVTFDNDNNISWPQLDTLNENTGLLNINDENKKRLVNYIYTKELVSKSIWYTLLSIITFFISINNVLNSEKCMNTSSTDVNEFKNYLATKL